ncbi:D-aminoacyl-tRNA deacylase [Candidatus Soleaferrea massiliensis]|uniref:D-aminoacyl-tRNA deacylase n=1 Tax=Candidatus Soleaferrea massiliensis TaxID=1470354 RepID=UPI0005916B66|nr:D-aminoacyl-tRNA deacylase [Candidatus Soleaferrea massiliensis]
MRAILQRVKQASVEIDGTTTARIEDGLMILLGVSTEDTEQQAQTVANKAAYLRIFDDENGNMNRSVMDVGGKVLLVSNFTLYANSRKGRRPSFTDAARPETAEKLYEYFGECLKEAGVQEVQTGVFGADMKVSILNDGPVTIILDSDEL